MSKLSGNQNYIRSVMAQNLELINKNQKEAISLHQGCHAKIQALQGRV